MKFFKERFEKDNIKNVSKIKVSSYIFAVISLFFIAAIVLLGYKWNGSRIVKSVTIIGNSYLSEKEVLNLIGSSTVNKMQKEISLSKLQHTINSCPYIKNTNIMFSSLETISVEISEKLPRLLLEQDSLKCYYVMDDLSCHPERNFERDLNLPLVKKISLKDAKDSILLRKIISFLDVVNNDNPEKSTIVKIIFDKEEELCDLYLSNINFGVKLKIDDNLLNEYENVLAFLKTEYFHKTSDRIEYIDARWNEKLYVMEKY